MQVTERQKLQGLETKNGNEKQCFLTANLRFNLRQRSETGKPTIIYCVVRLQGRKHAINSGVKIYPTQWNKRKQIAIISNGLTPLDNHNNTLVNNRLTAIKHEFAQTIEDLLACPDKIPSFIDTFAERLNIRRMARKKTTEQAFSKDLYSINTNDIVGLKTKLTRETSILLWERFIKQNGIADTPDNFNYNNWERFSHWLLEQRTKNGKQFTIGTINTYQNNIKALANQWNKSHPNTPINTKLLENTKPHKRPTDPQKQSKYIILSFEELEKVYRTPVVKIVNGKNKWANWENAKKLFVFQCLIGCRTSDLHRIIKGLYKIKDSKGLTFINYHSEKSNEQAFTPLETETAKELFEWVKSLSGFPFKHDSTYNQSLKKAFEVLGYTQETEYTEQRGTEIVTGHAPTYKIIHPHTARHIFATIMYYRGVPLAQVKLMTGHKDTDILEAVYRKLDGNKELDRLTDTLFKTSGKQKQADEPTPEQLELNLRAYANMLNMIDNYRGKKE